MNPQTAQKKTKIAIIGICLCFLLGSLGYVHYMRTQSEQDSVQYLNNAAAQLQNTLIKQIDGDFQTLEALAIVIGETGIDDADRMIDILETINNQNQFVRMGYADLSGNADLVDIRSNHHLKKQVSQDPFFQQTLAEGRSLSDPQLDEGEEWVGSYGMLIKNNVGEPIGVLIAENLIDVYRSILDAPLLNGEGYSLLVDETGAVLMRPHRELPAEKQTLTELGQFTEKTLDTLQNWLANGHSGSLRYRSLAGEQAIAQLIPLGMNRWYLFSAVPTAALHKNYAQTSLGMTIIITLAALIFLMLMNWQSRSMQANQRALETLAYQDPLTGDRNFASFQKEVPALIKSGCTVWYCDIKKFKYFNDLFGYEQGDALLRDFSTVVKASLKDDELFCRVSGDNFAGLRQTADPQRLAGWFNQLLAQLDQQMNEHSALVHLELCMGFFPVMEEELNLSVNEMVNRANIAHRSVKDQPGDQFAFFTPQLRAQTLRESELEAQAKKALARGEFEVYVQGKVNIQQNCRIVGGECLARWIHPEKGLIPPDQFIPLFEHNGMITQLDRLMFEKACAWLHDYLEAGRPPINLAVNVSRLDLFQDDFLDWYTAVKRRYAIPDGLLELEFTESVMLKDDQIFLQIVEELRKRGFICSLDDFGSGYSSLNILKNLPIQVLKLDILFFRKSVDIARERIIIRNILTMAHELQMKTIAEGVETAEQVEFLKAAGCDIVQGYVYFKPMPLADFDQVLQAELDQPQGCRERAATV
ncbi:GGDEF domain-containing protein [Holdemania filiformis]|uniref:bifunctional diguanylate cyclase/phosphodiesterase n=1 Tax=Holdemania filiformis TaxID=61171 RepID=UPI0022E84721|nr:GGDEF domain-containing protein [Holdemania filiformis]